MATHGGATYGERAVRQGRLAPRREVRPGLRTAWALSLAGFLPFAAATLFVLFAARENVWHALAVDAARTYGSVILSFLGGTRWGAGLGRPDAGRQFALAVIPSLVGWFSLFTAPVYGVALLALAFAAQGAWDAFSTAPAADPRSAPVARPLPHWFGRLRAVLTFLVVGALVVMFLALVR